MGFRKSEVCNLDDRRGERADENVLQQLLVIFEQLICHFTYSGLDIAMNDPRVM